MIGQQTPPLGPDDFNSAENRAFLAALQDAPRIAEEASPEDRLAELPELLWEHGRAILAEVRRRPPLTDEKLIKDLGDTLLRLRESNLHRQIQQVRTIIQENEETGPRDPNTEARQLHELMATYTAQKRHIQKLLNVRSMAGALAKSQAERKV